MEREVGVECMEEGGVGNREMSHEGMGRSLVLRGGL